VIGVPPASVQEQLLDRLFSGIAGGDIDAVGELYADDVEVWNSAYQRTMSRDESLAVLRSFCKRTEAVRYEVLERGHWDGGAMQRHLLHFRASGEDHALDVCITFAFADGHIARIFEYVDRASLAPLGW
jgi:ketosteroid isomerase-like protein